MWSSLIQPFRFMVVYKIVFFGILGCVRKTFMINSQTHFYIFIFAIVELNNSSLSLSFTFLYIASLIPSFSGYFKLPPLSDSFPLLSSLYCKCCTCFFLVVRPGKGVGYITTLPIKTHCNSLSREFFFFKKRMSRDDTASFFLRLLFDGSIFRYS